MVVWHHQLNRHESEQTPGRTGPGKDRETWQSCSPQGRKELDRTEQLNWYCNVYQIYTCIYQYSYTGLRAGMVSIYPGGGVRLSGGGPVYEYTCSCALRPAGSSWHLCPMKPSWVGRISGDLDQILRWVMINYWHTCNLSTLLHPWTMGLADHSIQNTPVRQAFLEGLSSDRPPRGGREPRAARTDSQLPHSPHPHPKLRGLCLGCKGRQLSRKP